MQAGIYNLIDIHYFPRNIFQSPVNKCYTTLNYNHTIASGAVFLFQSSMTVHTIKIVKSKSLATHW